MEDLAFCQPDLAALSLSDSARFHCAVVVNPSGQRHLLASPQCELDRQAWARSCLKVEQVLSVSPETLTAWISYCEGLVDKQLGLVGSHQQLAPSPIKADAEVLTLSSLGTDESPAIRLINTTLYEALRVGASDVHLEMDSQGLTVKYRIDGVLNMINRVDGAEPASHAISRIKVLAELDIAERRIPQDGRIQFVIGDHPVDVRVSIMPSIHGEDAVLRILDRRHLAHELEGLTLNKLGFDQAVVANIHKMCRKPHGMFLVTGPTGSGKTTTLYAAISETHHSRDKIITIEDPVEYQLPGVLQIPVNEKKGLNFAKGLRSILRHDPDKILIGEIRDAETAEIAVQASLTGHLVFTTVHANSVFDVLGRFLQFDLDPYTLTSALNGVLAQRLLRRVCQRCAVPFREMGASTLIAGPGCESCRGTGYSGRLALGELLTMTPTMRNLLCRRAPQDELESEAIQLGWRPLREVALETVRQRLTTMEEIDRVVP